MTTEELTTMALMEGLHHLDDPTRTVRALLLVDMDVVTSVIDKELGERYDDGYRQALEDVRLHQAQEEAEFMANAHLITTICEVER